MQLAPFEFTNDRLRLIPEAGLREEMIESRPLLQTTLSTPPNKTVIFHNWHICSGTEMSDLPFVQFFFHEFCSVIIYNIIFIYFKYLIFTQDCFCKGLLSCTVLQ